MLVQNTFDGFSISGDNCFVKNCTSIDTGAGSTFANNYAANNVTNYTGPNNVTLSGGTNQDRTFWQNVTP